MARLIIVSNRSPVTVATLGDELSVEPSVGGLATGLDAPHRESGGLWIGWPGDTSALDPRQRAELSERLAALRIVPVSLTPDEIAGYYEGVSNGLLWPVFHSLIGQVPLQPPPFDVYEAANQRFADAVLAHHRPGDVIWIHDYQLMMVPALVRARAPGARIGFFLHIPFPPSEIFRTLPHGDRIVQGLLGADLIGFHAPSYMRHFASTATRLLGVAADIHGVAWTRGRVRLGVFPMGIDAASFAALADDPGVVADAAALRRDAAGILVGIDRLDYTKGIPRRLLAFEALLDRHPTLRGRVRLIQLAVPSRTAVEAYQDLRAQVDSLVGRINGRFATANWTPVQYLYRGVSQREVVTLYRAANVMLVTPLRDGMNLVAKEFVASRVDEDGVLVLSEFTGAAGELAEAVVVNPYDVDATGEACARALAMAPRERRTRMLGLRHRVLAYDVHRWVRSFLRELEHSSEAARPAPRAASGAELQSLVARLGAAGHLVLLLDYDGTLVPLAPTPELAAPDDALLALLAMLAGCPNTDVHIVSGRPRETLDAWLGALPVGLHAEHGAWSRPAGSPDWALLEAVPTDWREPVSRILEDFAERTPGSLVEEKHTGLAWHYRIADPEYGTAQANELKLHLTSLLANLPVEVMTGDKVVEVRPHAFHKGRAVGPALAAAPPGALALAVGDDRTDQDLFAALPPDAVAIHVGPLAPPGPMRLDDVAAVRKLLAAVAAARAPG
jgi:trehalose 6-phosphate synthase/phosphatase